MNTNEHALGAQRLAHFFASPGATFHKVVEQLRTGTAPKTDCSPPEPADPILELSARAPYGDAGPIEGLWVGRWDTSAEQIVMDPIVSTGPSVGEWKGTVIYGRFKAPTTGNYRVAVSFHGHQISMHLSGPWGSSVMSSFDDTPTILNGDCSAMAGETVWFTLSCTGLYRGFAQKVQVSKL